MNVSSATNRQIMNAVSALNIISGRKLPFKVSYKVSKTLKQLQTFTTAFDETRIKIAREHAIKDDSGEPKLKYVDVNGTKKQVFDLGDQQQVVEDIIEELLDVDNEVNIQQIRVSDFDSDTMIEPALLVDIDWLIEDNPTE